MSQLTTSRTRIQTQPILPAILEEIETFEQEAKRLERKLSTVVPIDLVSCCTLQCCLKRYN